MDSFVKTFVKITGGVVEWLIRRTSNIRIANRRGSNHCFLEQETLHLLLSTGWFQEGRVLL